MQLNYPSQGTNLNSVCTCVGIIKTVAIVCGIATWPSYVSDAAPYLAFTRPFFNLTSDGILDSPMTCIYDSDLR